MVPNRLKFFFAGPVLEIANPLLPGRPHKRLAQLLPEDAAAVLELCAGTGYLSRLAAELRPAAELYALDLSPEMLAVGRRRAASAGLDHIEFVEGDAADLPFADDRFDVVLAAFGLHELPTDVRNSAVRETARVLRPGGRLLVVDLDAPARPSRVFSAYLRWMEKPPAREVLGDGLARLLASAGFEVVSRTEVHTRPVPFQLLEAVRPAVAAPRHHRPAAGCSPG